MRDQITSSKNDLQALREFATHHGYCRDEASGQPVDQSENCHSERPLDVCGAP
jgi:hypothetical protein